MYRYTGIQVHMQAIYTCNWNAPVHYTPDYPISLKTH